MNSANQINPKRPNGQQSSTTVRTIYRAVLKNTCFRSIASTLRLLYDWTAARTAGN